MSSRKDFFFGRIFPIPFLLVGVITLFIGLRGAWRAQASTDWPVAYGEVRSSKVDQHSDSDGTTYHAEVLYHFVVDGVEYLGNQVAFGDYGSSNPSHAQKIVNQYPAGETFAVSYHPDDPEVSVLDPGVKMQVWLLPGFGLIFFAIGSVVWVMVPRASRRRGL